MENVCHKAAYFNKAAYSSQFISLSILEQDLGDHRWRKTSQIPSHFNPNVWLFRHGALSQFNPSLGNGLIPNVLTANQHLSFTTKKKKTAVGGQGYRSKNLPRLFSHFKLQCSDLRTIARTNSVFGKESCGPTQDSETYHSSALQKDEMRL